MRRVLEVGIFLVLLAAAVAGITALAPAALPRATTVTPPLDTRAVCLGQEAAGDVHLDGADAVAPLGGQPQAASAADILTAQEEAVVATSTRAIVGGTHTTTGTAASWIPCAPAISDGILLVASTAATDLLVANSDPGDASVDLALLGTDGQIDALGARGIAVAPGATRQVALSVLAPVEGPVAVEASTARGRATMAARTSTGTVLDGVTLSVPGDRHHLGGVPAGASRVQVLLANPTAERVTASVIALGTTSRYTPEGGQELSLAPRSTLAVDLGSSLAGEASGLVVEADGDVAAGLVVDSGGDQGSAPPLPSGTELAAFGPGGGVLQLSNPSSNDAPVRVGQDAHTVPAGTTLTVQLSAEPAVTTVTSGVELFGAVVHSEATGTFVVGLQPSGEPANDPVAAQLDPSLR